jgi:hypothetical protein
MTERCYGCGSVNIEVISLEMSFAQGTSEPVYALGKPVVCLDCGLMECSLPEEALGKLKQGALLRGAGQANIDPALRRIA